MIRVFVVDDHELIRMGVGQAIDREEDMDLVGMSATARETLDVIGLKGPDVALLDLRLPDGDGVELCREIRSRHPEIRCLLFTSFADDEAVLEAVVAGASGFVLKEIEVETLMEAIRAIGHGRSLLDPDTIHRVLERASDGSELEKRAQGLTEQERNVLRLIGRGLTNREIAGELFIAEQTVKNYVSSLLKKLDLQRRTQAAIFATELERQRPSKN